MSLAFSDQSTDDNDSQSSATNQNPESDRSTNVQRTSRNQSDVIPVINDCFDNTDLLHNHQLCLGRGCVNISKNNQDVQKGVRDKFQHQWLSREMSYCDVSGYWWLAYMEGAGMFCLLCKKHNVFTSGINQYVTGAKRFKRQAVDDHAKSANHKQAIAIEMTMRVSVFHKESTEKEKVGKDVQRKAFLAAYWLMKEEVPNKKFLSLISMMEQSGLDSMKYFDHKSQGTLQEIFLLIGDTLHQQIIDEVNSSPVFSILVDEATDISVKCQMVIFIQYLDKLGNPVVNFLESRDVLGDSVSADSETLLRVLKECTKELDGNKLCGLVTDGASTMTGKINGLAARIKREHPTVLSVHCICHRLALACTDSNKDCKFVADTSDILRYLWKFFEDSPKRTATLVKVQMEMAKCTEQLPKKSRIAIVHKVKKACSTRWLSFNEAVHGCYDDLPSIMQCLSLLEKDVVATGLLKKMKNVRFGTSLFILKEILPILAKLSKTFQAGTINFSCIEPSIQEAKDALTETSLTEKVMTTFVQETKENERLGFLEFMPTEAQIKEATGKMSNYVQALVSNLDDRFKEAAPLLAAFSIFDPCLLPDKSDQCFKNYGNAKLESLGSQFFVGEETNDELLAEWVTFKYHMTKIKVDLKEEKKSTEVVLQRLMSLKNPLDNKYIFSKLAHIAAIILSLPVSNAWPERGASALKRIKTRLRSRLKDNMLSGLLQVSINGPPVEEATEFVNTCVNNWYEAKPRRKLKEVKAKDKVKTAVPREVVETADASVQADMEERTNEEVKTKMAQIMKLLKLTGYADDNDGDLEDADSMDDFDYNNVMM